MTLLAVVVRLHKRQENSTISTHILPHPHPHPHDEHWMERLKQLTFGGVWVGVGSEEKVEQKDRMWKKNFFF